MAPSSSVTRDWAFILVSNPTLPLSHSYVSSNVARSSAAQQGSFLYHWLPAQISRKWFPT